MITFATIRHVFGAVFTAFGVVFGLMPDPTASPMLVPIEHDLPL